MTEQRTTSADMPRRRSDYEQYVGNHTTLIFEGHPGYCALTQPHDAHVFHYDYLADDNTVWTGYYNCSGEPVSFAKRETHS